MNGDIAESCLETRILNWVKLDNQRILMKDRVAPSLNLIIPL